jgi:hypothetical protein
MATADMLVETTALCPHSLLYTLVAQLPVAQAWSIQSGGPNPVPCSGMQREDTECKALKDEGFGIGISLSLR